MGILSEIRKWKGTGVWITLACLALVPVAGQGYLGIMAKVSPDKVYITALSLFFRMFFLIAIGVVVSLSFFNETRKGGRLNFILHGISESNLLVHKWWAFHLALFIYVIVAFGIAGGVILFVGGNPLNVYASLGVPFVFILMSTSIVINLQYLMTLAFRGYEILALFVVLLISAGNLFISSTVFWIYVPWSYPFRLLYFDSLTVSHLWTIVGLFVLSTMLVSGVIVFKRRRAFF